MAISQTEVSQLYVSLMGRASEFSGSNYWQNNYTSQLEAANAMLGSQAVANYFGNSLNTDRGFVETIYLNTLNKTADGANGTISDAAGINYWIGRLDGSTGTQMSRAEMLVSFIDVAQSSVTEAGTQFSNRVEVSNYASNLLSVVPSDYSTSLAFHNTGLEGLIVTNDFTTITNANISLSTIASGNNLKTGNRNGTDFSGDGSEKFSLDSVEYSISSQEANQVISLNNFKANPSFDGIDGSGHSIVILDTGIDLNHPFFGDDLNNDGVSDRIVYSYDFTDENDGTANDENGHGTNVASIAASSSSSYAGVASGADIIALQILDSDGHGYTSWQENALQWVIDNVDTYNITAINMSLGNGQNEDGSTISVITDELAALNNLGVINVAAAGNEYFHYQADGAASPATERSIVSVGATFDEDGSSSIRWSSGAEAYSYEQDAITPFSQRSNNVVDIFAPGATLTGAAPGGGISSMTGTSQASPIVAGTAVLAQQLAQQELGRNLTQDEFVSLMNSTGVSIVDGDNEDDNVTNTGETYKRLDINALGEAIKALPTGGGNVSTDIANNIYSKGTIALDESVTNTLEVSGDKDWFKISLEEGVEYQFDLVSNQANSNGLIDPWLGIHDASGHFLSSNDDGINAGLNSSLVFIASYSGDYFLSAEAYGLNMTGDYTLSATQTSTIIQDDYKASIQTTGTLLEGITKTGTIEMTNDSDWFAVSLEAGNTYTIDLKGTSTNSGTLEDTYIDGLYNSTGDFIVGTSNDNGGVGYNSQLIYEATQDGIFYIAATANGLDTGTYTLDMQSAQTASDDYASTTSTTGSLLVDSSVTGNIETIGDTDWFEVYLQDGYSYTIDLEGSPTGKGTLSDTYLRGLYDISGNRIVGTTNDDSGTGLNSQVVYDISQSNTYYISAGAYGSYTGTYTLRLSDEQIIADDYLANTSTTGLLALNSSITGNIEVENDIDWFSVTLHEGYTYDINLEGNTLSDSEIYGIYDSNARYIFGTNNNGGSANSDATLQYTPGTTGTYYIAAKGFGSSVGSYTLNISEEIYDDYSSDIYTAGTISLNSSSIGTIETANDTDWFAVYLTAGNEYTIDLVGNSLNDAAITGIYNTAGNLIANTQDDNSGLGNNAHTVYEATTTGLYYISSSAADSSTGTYTLSINERVLSDDYTSNALTTGLLSTTSTATGNIETSHDTDWFEVNLQDGYTYTINLEGSPTGKGTLSDTYLRGLYNSSGNLVMGTTNDDSGTGLNSQVIYEADTTGTYYVSAGAFGTQTGTYELSISEELVASIDDYSSNTSRTGVLFVGSSATGNIETAYDRDWFEVNLEANQSYTINLEGSPTGKGTLSDTYIRGLYDSFGNLVMGTTNDDSGTGLNSRVLYESDTAGTYYVSAGAYGANTGTYELSMSTNASVSITATDSIKNEGDSGITEFTFTVTRDGDTSNSATVDWNVSGNGSNLATTDDFENSVFPSGTVHFAQGEDTQIITVNVLGDTDFENNESFSVELSNPVGMSLEATYIGTSINDSASGGSEVRETYYTLSSNNGGDFTLSYEMYSIPDQVDIFVNSILMASTGGLVSGTGTLTVNSLDMHINDEVLVRMIGNDDSGTAWNYSVNYEGGIQELGSLASSTIRNDDQEPDDFSSDVLTEGLLTIGSSVTGNIADSYDTDWFAVNLVENQSYIINLEGSPTSKGTLGDTYLRGIYDSNGDFISGTTNDDDGAGTNSIVTYEATLTGVYYISAGGYGSSTGTYELSIDAL